MAEPILLSMSSVAALLDTSETQVRRWVDAGILPQPVLLGRTKRWRRTEVLAAVGLDTPGPAAAQSPAKRLSEIAW